MAETGLWVVTLNGKLVHIIIIVIGDFLENVYFFYLKDKNIFAFFLFFDGFEEKKMIWKKI